MANPLAGTTKKRSCPCLFYLGVTAPTAIIMLTLILYGSRSQTVVCGSGSATEVLVPQLLHDYWKTRSDNDSSSTFLTLTVLPPSFAEVTVIAEETAEGLDRLSKGTCDIAMASAFADAKRDRLGRAIALDAVVLIANAESGATDPIGRVDLARILAGEANWKEFGGVDRPVSLYARPTAAALRDDCGVPEKSASGTMKHVTHWSGFHGQLGAAACFTGEKAAQEIVDHVQRDPGGLGVVPLSHTPEGSGNFFVIAVFEDDETLATEPNPSAVASGEYPLWRMLSAHIRTGMAPRKQRAAEALVSSFETEGQTIVEEEGFVPLSRLREERFVNFRGCRSDLALHLADRLTPTFLYDAGQATRTWSPIDHQRFELAMRQVNLSEEMLVLVGGADGKASQRNCDFAHARIKDALIALFGSIVNRRVASDVCCLGLGATTSLDERDAGNRAVRMYTVSRADLEGQDCICTP